MSEKDEPVVVTGGQIRAARALLNLSAEKLAKLTKLSRGTIQRMEMEGAQVTAANSDRIVTALQDKGIIFIPSNGDGPGVRLRQQKESK
jgi:transcriptional regulator with XRE-family HTH domain